MTHPTGSKFSASQRVVIRKVSQHHRGPSVSWLGWCQSICHRDDQRNAVTCKIKNSMTPSSSQLTHPNYLMFKQKLPLGSLIGYTKKMHHPFSAHLTWRLRRRCGYRLRHRITSGVKTQRWPTVRVSTGRTKAPNVVALEASSARRRGKGLATESNNFCKKVWNAWVLNARNDFKWSFMERAPRSDQSLASYQLLPACCIKSGGSCRSGNGRQCLKDLNSEVQCIWIWHFYSHQWKMPPFSTFSYLRSVMLIIASPKATRSCFFFAECAAHLVAGASKESAARESPPKSPCIILHPNKSETWRLQTETWRLRKSRNSIGPNAAPLRHSKYPACQSWHFNHRL